MRLAWQPKWARFTYSEVQSRKVDAFRWKGAAVDTVVRAVPVWAKCGGDPSAEFHPLLHSLAIKQVPQTLPQFAREHPETEPKLTP